MPTANEELLDATVRHQIVVLRFSDRMAADAARLLEASDRELVAMLQTELTEFAEARLNAMLIEVRRLRAAAIQAVDADVRPERRAELMEALLDLNPSVPLSAFGRVDGRFVLVGALARGARAEDVAHEVAVLSDNALDALDALADYLN